MKWMGGSLFAERQPVEVEIDGKIYKRVVRYRMDCGLYIVVNNRLYFEYECDYSQYYKESRNGQHADESN